VARGGSLVRRLLLTTALILVTAFAGTIALLEYIFRESVADAIVEQLATQVYGVISAAEPDDTGNLTVPLRLLEPRLRNPGSGLYAEILDGDGLPLWRSPSSVGVELGTGQTLKAGERAVFRQRLADGVEVQVLGVGISWQLSPAALPAFQVFAATDLSASAAEIRAFRRQLLGWFSGIMLVLLAALGLALQRGLVPVRRLAAEIRAVEGGERDVLGDGYPVELDGVTRGLNTLLLAERQRMTRYRTTMDDLAHSLKTPLAVVGAELDGGRADNTVLREQVARMQGVVDYQLRRAAASGPRSLAAKPVALRPVAEEVGASLAKIHRDKAVILELTVAPDLRYPAETGDLYEILGNLLDNAWKWCRSRVGVTAIVEFHADGRAREIVLAVGDDGPGVPAAETDAVLARGRRSDARGDVPGQGIGLAVVNEIVGLYGGRVVIGRSPLGGAAVEVRLPVA
jgi:two-component system, OmpR family, sensor histidine kinase PhoQ